MLCEKCHSRPASYVEFCVLVGQDAVETRIIIDALIYRFRSGFIRYGRWCICHGHVFEHYLRIAVLFVIISVYIIVLIPGITVVVEDIVTGLIISVVSVIASVEGKYQYNDRNGYQQKYAL